MSSDASPCAISCRPSTTGWPTRPSLADLVRFIALEGGPDAGFDDLVALCQIGISGTPKVTLGANYWDEMGRGEPSAVHTELHHRMAEALDLPRRIPPERSRSRASSASRSTVSWPRTAHCSRSSSVGLGLLECQAGPRCRRVAAALRRLGAPPDALPFYEEHALADPRHGKDWLDGAVAPLVERTPAWGTRIVQGARWRAYVNRRFFDALERHFVGSTEDLIPRPRPQAA